MDMSEQRYVSIGSPHLGFLLGAILVIRANRNIVHPENRAFSHRHLKPLQHLNVGQVGAKNRQRVWIPLTFCLAFVIVIYLDESLTKHRIDNPTTPSTSTSSSSSRRATRRMNNDRSDPDVQMSEPNDVEEEEEDDEEDNFDDEDHDEDMADPGAGEDDEHDREDEYEHDEDDEDVFEGSYLGGVGSSGISNTLRALSGMVSGISSRLRDILTNLRQKDDPSTQLIALQELAEILLVSTEDNLSGHFSPDQFVKELVSLMEDQGPFGENPDMMLLACRCIANLMEALPAATANVVYGGAVPVLCRKLMEIQYIDLAEQALSVCNHKTELDGRVWLLIYRFSRRLKRYLLSIQRQ